MVRLRVDGAGVTNGSGDDGNEVVVIGEAVSKVADDGRRKLDQRSELTEGMTEGRYGLDECLIAESANE